MVENQSDPSPKLDVVHLVLPSCELSNPKLPLIILKMKTQQYTQKKENWCTLKTCIEFFSNLRFSTRITVVCNISIFKSDKNSKLYHLRVKLKFSSEIVRKVKIYPHSLCAILTNQHIFSLKNYFKKMLNGW